MNDIERIVSTVSALIKTSGPNAILEAQRREITEREQARRWWAEQPARIAARLAGGRS